MESVKLISSENESVVIGFYGKLNVENAGLCDAALKKIREENPQGSLVFDFDALNYISSAGLRVILKYAKGEKNRIKIINVDDNAYTVLESTGFVRIFTVEQKLKRLHKDDLTLIGQGANASVYRIDDENIVKVFAKHAPMSVIRRERAMAQEALIAGLPTAISQSIVEVDDSYGIVFELINASTLAQTLATRPKDFDFFMDKYISLYRTIHETKPMVSDFPSIKEVYYDAIKESRDFYTKEEQDKLTALVDSIPDSRTLIHGDYNPNNIMVQDDELLLIDMGDLSLGHVVFDFLSTATSTINVVRLDEKFAETFTHMPVPLVVKVWRGLIDTYFKDKSKEERDRIEKQICLMAKLKVGLAPAFGRNAPEEIVLASVNDGKTNLLPHIDELIGAIDW